MIKYQTALRAEFLLSLINIVRENIIGDTDFTPRLQEHAQSVNKFGAMIAEFQSTIDRLSGKIPDSNAITPTEVRSGQ